VVPAEVLRHRRFHELSDRTKRMMNTSTAYGEHARLNESALGRNRAGDIGVSRNSKVLLFLLLLFASADFIVRGPVRIIGRAAYYNDYTSSYIGAKAWIKGLNPYSNVVFWDLWKQSSKTPVEAEESIGSRTPYPWTCFLLLAPLSLFNAAIASLLMGLISSALIVVSLWLLSGLPDLAEAPGRRWLFLGLALAMSPVHGGLGQMNISMMAIAFVFLSFWAASTERPGWAGVFCALSVCLKPPIGVFLAVFYLFSRQWKAFVTTTGTTILLAAVAIARLQLAGVPWLSGYLANSKLVLTDPINAITAANPKRFQMVNLQLLWYALAHNERLANELALGITALLLAALVVAVLRQRGNVPASLQVSAFAAISLLPMYHRFYDASLLVFPLLWSLSIAPEIARAYRRAVLLLLVPFAVPGAWALEKLQNEGRLPAALTGKWWWVPVALGHEIWAILLLAVLLVAANWLLNGRPACANCTAVRRENRA
jgi:hypothetical protein